MPDDLLTMKNIGAKTADRLIDVGIVSREQLEGLGAVAVFRRLRRLYPASRTMLWALQGAIMGLPYYHIPPEIRAALLNELEQDEL